MSKQKRNCNISHIRPTSYSHVYTNQELDKLDNKSKSFFSNLLHNYQKVTKAEQQSPKLTVLKYKKGGSGSIKVIEVQLKQLQKRLPFQLSLLTQRSSFNPERRRLSNYSLYLEKSASKNSRHSSSRFVSPNQITPKTSQFRLLEPCKITSMRIQSRKLQPTILKEFKNSNDYIRKRNKQGRSRMNSNINVNKKIGEDMIQPWGLKNFESLVL